MIMAKRSPADKTWNTATWCIWLGALGSVLIAAAVLAEGELTALEVIALAVGSVGATAWLIAGAVLRGIARILDALEDGDDE